MNDRKNGPRMSPRIKAQLNQQDTPQVSATTEKPLSTNEGQETAVLEHVLGSSGDLEMALSGSNLAPEDLEKVSPKIQNLDSSDKGLVAVNEGLEAILGEITQSEAEIQEIAPQETLDLAKALQDSVEVVSGVGGEQNVFTPPLAHQPRVEPNEALEEAGNAALGPQADGSYNVVVNITEEYIEGVKEAARTDGRSVDQWSTERFAEYLEAYYSPAKGR